MKNKKRFEVVKESKFQNLSQKEMESVMGGLCISCMKRARKVVVGIEEGEVSAKIYF